MTSEARESDLTELEAALYNEGFEAGYHHSAEDAEKMMREGTDHID
jgi:hypothetical protein